MELTIQTPHATDPPSRTWVVALLSSSSLKPSTQQRLLPPSVVLTYAQEGFHLAKVWRSLERIPLLGVGQSCRRPWLSQVVHHATAHTISLGRYR
jgi:hypothetical protein